MLKQLKHTVKQTAIYSIGSIGLKLIGFILLPLYTNYLTTADYGALAILEITSSLLVAIFGFRLSTAMMRWISSESTKEKNKSYISTTFISLLLIIIILNLLLHPFNKQIGTFLLDIPGNENLIRILILVISFEIFNVFVLDLIRIHEKSFFYVLLSICKIIVVLSLNIYFVKYLRWGITGVLMSQLIGGGIVFIVSIYLVYRFANFKFNGKDFIEMFRFGTPLVFSGISLLFLTVGDRYILKYLTGLSEVGVYSLGYKIASVINLFFIQSFQIGFLPIAYKNYNTPNANRFFSKTLTYFVFILIIGALALALFSKEVIFLLSNDASFNKAYTIVPFFCLVFVFKGIQYCLSLNLHYVKKTKYNAMVMTGAAVVNIMLNFLLIPLLGLYGAAISGIISWLLLIIVFKKISDRFYHVDYEVVKIILMIFLGIALYISSLFLNQFSILYSIIIKIGLLILFPLILFPFNFYEKVEINRLKGFYKKWNSPTKWKNNLNE